MTHLAISVNSADISETLRRQWQHDLFPNTAALIVVHPNDIHITPEHTVTNSAYVHAEETIRRMVPGASVKRVPAKIRPLGHMHTLA